MCINDIFLECVNKTYNDYCTEFDKKRLSIVKFYIANSISQKCKEIRPDRKDYRNIDTYNGLTVPPNKTDKNFSVIINTEYFIKSIIKKDCYCIGTIAHELTHLYDFIEYADIINYYDYESILDFQKHFIFNIWSEFHARAIGHYYIRKYISEDIYDKCHLDNIIQIELPFQLKEMYNSYSKSEDTFSKMCAIVGFLGKLYIWEKLFPTHFTEDFICSQIKDNGFINDKFLFDIYVFLKNHVKLNEAHKNFKELENILKQNF